MAMERSNTRNVTKGVGTLLTLCCFVAASTFYDWDKLRTFLPATSSFVPATEGGNVMGNVSGPAPVFNKSLSAESRPFLCNVINGTSDFGEWIELCSGDFLKASDELLWAGNDVHIVQIGAHVGFEPNDPLAKGMSLYLKNLTNTERKKLHWTFVEPSPPNYERLVENLDKHKDLCDMRSVNAAVVSDSLNVTDGMPFYSISKTIDPVTGYDSRSGKKLPNWITQVSSFSKKPILFNQGVFRRAGLNVSDYIVEANVTTKRYSELMHEIMAVKNVPWLVLIDTEGFDCDIILGMGPTSPFLPNYLVFENTQCGQETLKETYAFLKRLGYTVKDIGGSQNAVAMKSTQTKDGKQS